MNKWRQFEMKIRHPAESKPVPIVSDAAIWSRGVAEGRLIPLLILDTTHRNDINVMIRSHKTMGQGDSSIGWGKNASSGDSRIQLLLNLLKPSHCIIVLEFDIVRQGGLVDQIIQAQALYIQGGAPGDRLIKNPDHERLILEIPSSDFRSEWERMWIRAMTNDFKSRGMSRLESEKAARMMIDEWRRMTSRRMKSSIDPNSRDGDF